MIKTDRQYAITRAQLDRLTEALQGTASVADGDQTESDAGFAELERRALESQIADLQADLAAYDALREGGAAIIPVGSFADLPTAFIRARIAKGWTQADLARALGMAEQQVQRYESTEYASASFSRLRDVARALGIEVPSAVLSNEAAVTPKHFFRRLKELDFDRSFVFDKLLPADVAELLGTTDTATEAKSVSDSVRAAVARAGSVVARILGVDLAVFFSSGPLQLASAGAGARFKQTAPQAARSRREPTSGAPVASSAYALYAHYLALQLLEASAELAIRVVPETDTDVRRVLAEEYGGVSLEAALHFAWDLGIPVLPLADSGRFHGACWRVDGRNIIVLKQRTRSFARWLFDLLHELRHAGQHRDALDFTVVEREAGTDISDDEEDAMTFAGDVVLDGRAEELTRLAVTAAGGSVERLKRIVPEVAAREGVGTDSLANYVAHRLAMQGINWWGAANNLQHTDHDPFVAARDVLLQRANLSRINPLDRQLLLNALQGEPR